MAKSLNFVMFQFPVLTSVTNNSSTNLTQFTMNLPESGKVFKAVMAKVTAHDIISATGGTIGTRTIALSVNGAGATSISNTNSITHTGENYTLEMSADFTAQFVTNFTSTSHTIDGSVLFNQSTGTTLGMANVLVELYILYEFDIASTTRIKTVWIPLNAPVGAMASSKPGTATATIPALDTELPEASKSYKQIRIYAYGTSCNVSISDLVFNMQVDTLTAFSATLEQALASDRAYKYVMNADSLFTTNSTHNFYLWGTAGTGGHHAKSWMMVTYTYDEASTTSVYNSVMVPFQSREINGYTTSSDYLRVYVDYSIVEPGTITTKAIAAMLTYSRQAIITGWNMRLGTGSFVTYTDAGAVSGNSSHAMIRNDSANTLTRGTNTFNIDIYGSAAPPTVMTNISGYIIVNYTSSKSTLGSWAHSKNVFYTLGTPGTAAATQHIVSLSPTALSIPDTSYYIQKAVCNIEMISDNTPLTAPTAGMSVEETTSDARGIHTWRTLDSASHLIDGENQGTLFSNADGSSVFRRFSGDSFDNKRIDIGGTRIWRVNTLGLTTFTTAILNLVYHSMSFQVQGTISNSAGGTVNIYLHRASTGEVLRSTSRSGNGTFSIDWYDDTESLFIRAVESSTKKGISVPYAAGSASFTEVDLNFNSVNSLYLFAAGQWQGSGDSSFIPDAPNNGVDTGYSLIGDGWFEFKYGSNSNDIVGIVLKTNTTLNSYDNVANGVVGVEIVNSSGKKPQAIDINVATNLISRVMAVNDRLRIRRQGSTFTLEISSNSWVTYDVIHSYVNTSSATLYCHGYVAGDGAGYTSRLYNPKRGLPGATSNQFDVDLQPTGSSGTRYYVN